MEVNNTNYNFTQVYKGVFIAFEEGTSSQKRMKIKNGGWRNLTIAFWNHSICMGSYSAYGLVLPVITNEKTTQSSDWLIEAINGFQVILVVKWGGVVSKLHSL